MSKRLGPIIAPSNSSRKSVPEIPVVLDFDNLNARGKPSTMVSARGHVDTVIKPFQTFTEINQNCAMKF